MTVAELPTTSDAAGTDVVQRFVFPRVDWAFYEEVGRRVEGRRTFVTYYKGRLEVVTTSLLHELISSLLTVTVGVLAEEQDVPLIGSGRTTLRRVDLDEGTEPDSSFYISNQPRMAGHEEIDLLTDPPPDLAIEVEVTRRLGQRRSIYQDMGVPEIWVYGVQDGLRVLLRQSDGIYTWADHSPTFPILSLAEITAAVRAGISEDQTAFTKAFRRRVREALGGRQP